MIFDYEKKQFKNEKQGTIPFIPINHFDERIEKYTSIDLVHCLILFNVDNFLCAYIDLFNTFQYYVILSESYEGALVYHNYCQKLTKREFDEEQVKESLRINRLKDAHIIMTQYNISLEEIDKIENETDIKEKENETIEKPFEKLENQAYEKSRIEPYRIELDQWVHDKSYCCDSDKSTFLNSDSKESARRLNDIMFYLVNKVDENNDEFEYEEIEMKRFRIYTFD